MGVWWEGISFPLSPVGRNKTKDSARVFSARVQATTLVPAERRHSACWLAFRMAAESPALSVGQDSRRRFRQEHHSRKPAFISPRASETSCAAQHSLRQKCAESRTLPPLTLFVASIILTASVHSPTSVLARPCCPRLSFAPAKPLLPLAPSSLCARLGRPACCRGNGAKKENVSKLLSRPAVPPVRKRRAGSWRALAHTGKSGGATIYYTA